MIGSNRTPRSRRSRFVATALAGAFAFVVLAASAQAFHIPGATYTGTHASGGSFSLTVSPDGSAVTRISGTAVPTPSCTFDFTTTGTIPITNHAFNAPGSPVSVSGFFGSVQHAGGDVTASDPFCGSGTVAWTATTTASPAGSEECVAANQAVRQAKKKVKRAKNAKQDADTENELEQANQKLRKAKRKLRKAKNRREAVC